MMRQLTLVAAILLGSITAHANTITNFHSTFTSATAEVGTLTLDTKSSVSGGYLLLGRENGSSATEVTANNESVAYFGQSTAFSTNVVLQLDWTQLLTDVTTMAVLNDNGDTLFTLVTDTSKNLSWNGNGQSVAVGTLSNTSFTSIEIGLNADESVDLLIGGTSYTGLALNNFGKDVSSINFARGNAKGITANFDDVLVESRIEAIPEPAVASLIILFGTGVLATRRIFTK